MQQPSWQLLGLGSRMSEQPMLQATVEEVVEDDVAVVDVTENTGAIITGAMVVDVVASAVT
jgi:hypothetical protein